MNTPPSAVLDALAIKTYLNLCERFKEPFQTRLDKFGNKVPDCYGTHARKLRQRAEAFSTISSR